MTNSLKPLDLGRKVFTEEELIKQLEGYVPNPEPDKSLKIQGRYILMPRTSTYALGVHALQEACTPDDPQHNGVYRPLTFKENLQARVEDYESHQGEERVRLFNIWLDSCTGIAYKAGTNKFKIIPVCEQLITIDKEFNSASLSLDYDSLQGTELDKSKGKYKKLLTQQEILEHPGWLAAVEGDKSLLQAYADIVFAEKKAEKVMGFYPLDSWNKDQVRVLFVGDIYDDSNASGYYLNDVGSFLRVAPSQNFLGEEND